MFRRVMETIMRSSSSGPGDRKIFVPPTIRQKADPSEFVAKDHLFQHVPCTRYWHHERRLDVEGLAPPGIPQWIQRFDWVIGWAHGWADTKNYPQSVFCHPVCADALAEFVIKNWESDPLKEAILVLGGEDTHLSSQCKQTLNTLCRYFSDVFYEAKDCYHPTIKIMPIGLQEYYLRGCEDLFWRLVHEEPQKRDIVVAAWGRWWPKLNTTIEDRIKAAEFSRANPLFEFGVFPRDIWFQKLHSSRYMICPLGNGIQTPKMMEALLLSCIPILTEHPASIELKSRGFPIIVVKNWNEITKKLLEDEHVRLSAKVDEFKEIALSLDAWWDFSFGRRCAL